MNDTNRAHNFLYRCRLCGKTDASSGIGANDFSRIKLVLDVTNDQWDTKICGIPPRMLGLHHCADGISVGVTDFIGVQEAKR